jgi:hypothetical protein
MPIRSIEAVAQRLEELLPEAGWRVVEKEVDSHRVEDEFWRIESVWSPQGVVVCLRFVMDRHPGIPSGGKIRRRGIWMVRAYRVHPERSGSDRNSGDDLIFFMEKPWAERLRDFVKSLNRFRS